MKNLILENFGDVVTLNFLEVHYLKLNIWVSNLKLLEKDGSHIAMSLVVCLCDPIMGTSNTTNKSRRLDQIGLGIVSSS